MREGADAHHRWGRHSRINTFAKKTNVLRYLGYGAIDGNIILNCAADRATLWAVGNLVRKVINFQFRSQQLCRKSATA
jgi:hypothetical protein